MRLELARVADVPDVVADAIGLAVRPPQLLAGNCLAQRDRFLHRAIAVTRTAHVVHLADAGGLVELIKRRDQVGAMDVVPDLFALVAVDDVGGSRTDTLHQIGQEAVQRGPRVVGPGQASAPEARGAQLKVATVLLDQQVRRRLRDAEQGMGRGVDGHRLVDPFPIRVGGIKLPAGLPLEQRQRVGRVAVHLVGRGEDEGRLRAELAGRLQEDQGAVGVDGEVRPCEGWAAVCTTRLMSRPKSRKIASMPA